ncbi:MAG TPA: glycoside hydrolase domain-containing protein [Verrucomicrobiae bacterium]
MKARLNACAVCLLLALAVQAEDTPPTASGTLLPAQAEGVTLWWALSSAAKIQPAQAPPKAGGESVLLGCARNEREAVQLVVRSGRRMEDFRITCGALTGPNSASIAAANIELLQVMYLTVTQPSDRGSIKGLCPDPLLPIHGPLELQPDFNHAFWVRVFVPTNTPAGLYRGTIELRAKDFHAQVPLQLTVYDFALPDRMTCTTAFGFSPGNVFRYHALKTDEEKRLVLNKYWANLAAHHISPYDPAPLDPIRVKWPEVHPPKTTWDNWTGLRIVSNEVHSGQGALLIYDDKTNENVTAGYEPLIKIPPKGLRVKCWYRTAVPGHRFIVTLNHYDAQRQWMSGRNNDITLRGSGQWQNIDQLLTDFPPGAEYVRFQARATVWTDRGEEIGLVWFDDISITDPDTGKELVEGGDFERKPRTEPVVPLEQLKAQIDFAAWDRAMSQTIDRYHFNSFRLDIPGIGGGTFHEITPPGLLGFGEETPEYPVLFDSYCRELEAHLQARGWLDEAFIYWFDEPSADQYPFVMNGFAKLKRSCPHIARMLTEQVEPTLIGGPDIWCSISDSYDHSRAEPRRQFGEKFWWYVCTGPKAPYTGLFIDHPAPEMRIWLWQTFQRNIEGILVWETTYWTSSAAYPDAKQPQNPYTDPMSWTSGYSTPSGDRRPWGNGDGRFIYPPFEAADGKSSAPVLEGPVDSIRWEQLRDGLEDYEYLCILRTRLAQRKNNLPADRQQQYARLLVVPETITRSLTEFTRDGAPIDQQRQQIARAIEQLR